MSADDWPCDYCDAPSCTVTRFGSDQACMSCAAELDAAYAGTLRGRLEEFHQRIASLWPKQSTSR